MTEQTLYDPHYPQRKAEPPSNKEMDFLLPPQNPELSTYEGIGDLFEEHRQIAAKYSVNRPYFELTGTEAPFLRVKHKEFDIKVGTVGSFSSAEMAKIINEQILNYISQETMGSQFPQDEKSKEELTALMIGDFQPNRVVVVIEKTGIPIASVQGHFGQQDTPLFQTIHHPWNGAYVPSTLASYQSLSVRETHYSFRRFLAEYGKQKESSVVCMSRLYKQEKWILEQLHVELPDAAWICMALLAVGIAFEGAAQERAGGSQPILVVYDTHSDYIQKKLKNYFGMMVIATANQVQPSPEVLQTILRYHYGTEGYQGEVFLGAGRFDEYLIKAQAFLREKGIDTPPIHGNHYKDMRLNQTQL
ncbi:hypothetical protein C5B42_05690 [Candidatus Cerribacteria bacterium 'Amazon FNV 2010 28 9']|uniref:Uncharacterized protein n=1 Tax=Candidatus Cerribacteria bacterium 'Amazon FNV 2010 28 9' TaxID=2081795 RepID=A0A317JLW2_9BACT|nr:MAG: hypothetical protein C5B42_05690 [Candidatus Cerribacteria bacterium 'Amazon FNV 2010 28 9']